MGKSQRTKGASGEREICHILRDALGIEVGRNLEQSRSGGCDIKLPPYCIEVKRRRRVGNLYDWVRQADAACGPGERPIVCVRADGAGWLAVLPLHQLIPLIREEIA